MTRPEPGAVRRHGRREILKASLAVAAGANAHAAAGAAPADRSVADAGDAEQVVAGDVRRIATVLYGLSLTPEQAQDIARIAAGALANLKYLALLKSDDVQLAFGYPALVDEASRTAQAP